jgi:adenylate cyclase
MLSNGSARKLAAILAADVVGYSRQIAADEPGTLARLRTLRAEVIDPLLTEHGGRLFKTMGDGFLVEFVSAVQALQCALAIQRRVTEHHDALPMRIGVHQGDVVAEGDDLLGDGVNIAARLEVLAEPGGICISARVREDALGKIPLDVTDLGTPPLKSIDRPIHVFSVRVSKSSQPALALPDRPSIAVLAFTNMSGDAEQEYFGDGIAEDIITALAQIRWLFVIARNSSFTYKGRPVDLKQVGRELGVRYVLEGSVRRSGNRLRIAAQLIQAVTGTHVWADRYDRTLEDIFAIQDEITTSVVNAIDSVLAATERERVGRLTADRLGSWELYHRGMWHFYRLTADDRKLALEYLQHAETADPGWATVHTGLAVCYILGGWLFAQEERNVWIPRSIEHARLAIDLNARDAEAHAILGVGLVYSDQHEASIECSIRAVELNPTNAWVRAKLGASFVFSGRPGEGLPHLEAAARLSPLDPLRWTYSHFLAIGYLFRGDYEASLNAGKNLARMQPGLWFGYRHCCAALTELGRMDEARYYADQLFSRFAKELTSFLTARWGGWREPDYRRYTATLARAGLVLRDGVLLRSDGDAVS